MRIKRLRVQPSRRFLFDTLTENFGAIISLGVIGGVAYAIGFIVYDVARLQTERIEAKKATEKAKKEILIIQERINTAKLVAEEKLKPVKIEVKKDALIADLKAKKEALQLMQEEYENAKKNLLVFVNS